MESESIKPIDILNERERRETLQRELTQKYKGTLITVRVNYPGLYKNNKYSKKIINYVIRDLRTLLKSSIYRLYYENVEGPIFINMVNGSAEDLKKQCIEFEETHFLGRFVDIDIYDKDYNIKSRSDFNKKPRLCYLCNEYAHVCVRSKKHKKEDLINFIHLSVDKFEKSN